MSRTAIVLIITWHALFPGGNTIFGKAFFGIWYTVSNRNVKLVYAPSCLNHPSIFSSTIDMVCAHTPRCETESAAKLGDTGKTLLPEIWHIMCNEPKAGPHWIMFLDNNYEVMQPTCKFSCGLLVAWYELIAKPWNWGKYFSGPFPDLHAKLHKESQIIYFKCINKKWNNTQYIICTTWMVTTKARYYYSD